MNRFFEPVDTNCKLVSQWVSVDDRLPLKIRINGEPVYYLCKHASWGCVFVGCFLSKSHGTVWAQQIFHEDNNRRFSVSHWMEIPEPPEVKNDEIEKILQ